MTSLIRTKSSVFDIENSLRLDEIKAAVEKGGKNSVLSCVDKVFMNYPKTVVTDKVKQRLKSGAFSLVGTDLGTYRAYDKDGTFIGVAEVFRGEKGNVIKIIKAF